MSLAPRGDGVGENRVDELNDRRFVHLRGKRGGVDFFLFGLDNLEVFFIAEAGDVLEERGHLHVRGLVQFLEDVPDGELPGDDREDVVARDELEVVDDREVRRVGHGDGQGAPVALEREDEILRREIGRD